MGLSHAFLLLCARRLSADANEKLDPAVKQHDVVCFDVYAASRKWIHRHTVRFYRHSAHNVEGTREVTQRVWMVVEYAGKPRLVDHFTERQLDRETDLLCRLSPI